MRVMKKAKVLLVAFYNQKALGVRYLESALTREGHSVRVVYYKDFNSLHPKPTTKAELDLLCREVERWKPDLMGLSVMSSMYLDTVNAVLEALQGRFSIPIVCGGAFATMFPAYFLDRGVDLVLRGDGEIPLCRLAEAVVNGLPYERVPSLCYRRDGQDMFHEIGGARNDIDSYGLPVVNSPNACWIDRGAIHYGDPQRSTLSYEVIASRGCPFTCSYCCCSNLRKLLPPGIHGVRTRSVKSVIDELREAKKQCKGLAFIHFYDEIFPDLPGWVDEFVAQYQKYIALPFTIWTHPKMVKGETLKKLVAAGLTEVIMGIQSGSERVRREVFHRYETQEDILEATRLIRESGVFWCSYDFMLQHPFETLEDLKESYWLAKKMTGPYELQLHGLNFLPGTDIVPMAVEGGYYTQQELDAIMYAPMEEQFSVYWRRTVSRDSDLWYKMLYCLQFKWTRRKIEKFEKDPAAHGKEIDKLYAQSRHLAQLRYLYKKSHVVLKRLTMKKC